MGDITNFDATEDEVLEALDAFERQARLDHKATWLAQMRELLDFLEADDNLDAPPGPADIMIWPTMMYNSVPLPGGDYIRPIFATEDRDRATRWLQESAEALRRGAPAGEVRKFDNSYSIGAERVFELGGRIAVHVQSSLTCEVRPVLNPDGTPKMERQPVVETREVEGEYTEVPVTERVCPPFVAGWDD